MRFGIWYDTRRGGAFQKVRAGDDDIDDIGDDDDDTVHRQCGPTNRRKEKFPWFGSEYVADRKKVCAHVDVEEVLLGGCYSVRK